MNPDKTFHLRQLSREPNTTYRMLYEEEKNLATLSILTEEKKGKITLISINKNISYFTELENLITKTAGSDDLQR
jgi:hypothetical protein